MKTAKIAFLALSLFFITCSNSKKPTLENEVDISKGQRVLFEIPGMDDVIVKKDIPYLNIADSTLKMDIYYPPKFNFKSKIPAIIIVYGVSDIAAKKLIGRQFRNWNLHISWCKLIAASGIASIVYSTVDPENDIVLLTKYIDSNHDKLLIDMDNIGAFAFSGHTPTAVSNILNSANNIFSCAVFYYGYFLTQDFKYLSQIDSVSLNKGFKTPRLTDPISWKKDVPILIVRAGLDNVPYLNQSLLNFYNNAINQNLPIIMINYPQGLHGFEFYNDNDTTRAIIKSTIDFWKLNLLK